jgi:hypothetical protein
MSIIPLDLQRRCEQRWAARFSRLMEPVASRKRGSEMEGQQIAAPGEDKRKTRLAKKPTRFRSAPAV